MITVNKLRDEVRKAELIERYGLCGYDFMITYDGDTEKAVTAVKAEGDTLLLNLISAEEYDMADMAIRSALAYGDNRGAITAVAMDRAFEKAFQRVGFTEKDGVFSIEICKVVHYCG